MALVCICRFINYCCFISKTVQCQCVSLLGGLSGKTQIRQASRQLYHDSEEFPLLERTPALPENEAVCDPNTGLGTRLSGKEVCVEMRFPKEVFLFTENRENSTASLRSQNWKFSNEFKLHILTRSVQFKYFENWNPILNLRIFTWGAYFWSE